MGTAGISVTNLLMLAGPLFMLQVYDRSWPAGASKHSLRCFCS